MGTLAAGRKSLLSKNGYQYNTQRKAWVGPGGKEILDNNVRKNTETWLDNTIRTQQDRTVR